jgi:hypothetical protein
VCGDPKQRVKTIKELRRAVLPPYKPKNQSAAKSRENWNTVSWLGGRRGGVGEWVGLRSTTWRVSWQHQGGGQCRLDSLCAWYRAAAEMCAANNLGYVRRKEPCA